MITGSLHVHWVEWPYENNVQLNLGTEREGGGGEMGREGERGEGERKREGGQGGREGERESIALTDKRASLFSWVSTTCQVWD